MTDPREIIKQAIMDAASAPPTADLPALAAKMVEAALEAAGLAIVPVGPTPEMVIAGAHARDIRPSEALAAYNAMISARPGGSDG